VWKGVVSHKPGARRTSHTRSGAWWLNHHASALRNNGTLHTATNTVSETAQQRVYRKRDAVIWLTREVWVQKTSIVIDGALTEAKPFCW